MTSPAPVPQGFQIRIGRLLLIAAVLVVAGMGTGRLIFGHPASTSRPAAAATATADVPLVLPAPPPAPLTVVTLRPDLETVLDDLRAADRIRSEAWVTGGYSHDFAVLITLTDDASGTDPVNVNARLFSTDAYAYTEENTSPVDGTLAGDWRPGYAQVRADLNGLARDCGLAPVPAPAGGL